MNIWCWVMAGIGESARMNFWKLSSKSGSPGSHLRTSSNMSMLSDESASIMSMRSYSSLSSARWTEDCGMAGSHASTLDRLFAWEKKLYLEVKVSCWTELHTVCSFHFHFHFHLGFI